MFCGYDAFLTLIRLQVLAQDAELQEEAEKHAQNLAKWIMGVTNQKLKPGLILGRRLVGEPKCILTTERNAIYTANFVSGETVVLKMPQDQMQGRDPTAIFTVSLPLCHNDSCILTILNSGSTRKYTYGTRSDTTAYYRSMALE